MSTQYIISRSIDPIFAVGVGIAATAVRIGREEKEKGKSWGDSYNSLQRRLNFAFNASSQSTQSSTAPAEGKK